MIKLSDPVYGPITVDDPLLIEVMESAAMQRLHGVLQHGISALIGITQPSTRFEHSVGVMTLVKLTGGQRKELVAALLHDVSHTAFSHVIDYVFDGHDSQSYHEQHKEAYLAGSDIPAVLARHGYDWRDFLDETDYPLLEQPSPALCADRLDYFLRDCTGLGLATLKQVNRSLQHLVVHDGRIGVDNLAVAQWLGYTFIEADEASWANFREVGLYEVTARVIKDGLSSGILSQTDIWRSDKEVWAKLLAAGDTKMQQRIRLISPQTRFVWDEINPDFRISTKLRTIDPDVLIDGEWRPLSQFDGDFARHRLDYLDRKKGKWPMRVVPG